MGWLSSFIISLWCLIALYCVCSKMTSSRLSAGTWKFRMLHLFSSLCIGRFVSLLANFYNKAVNSDAIEDSESMDIIGEFNAMQSRLLTNSSDVFTNLFDEVFPRIFLSVSSWKRKQTSECTVVGLSTIPAFLIIFHFFQIQIFMVLQQSFSYKKIFLKQ